ncbi:MAG: four helix bundle protein [Candidatus Magasanikbacteria bacterium]|nr:four helix bundle protein [Candidatus Magasanikbacteria bacterium]
MDTFRFFQFKVYTDAKTFYQAIVVCFDKRVSYSLYDQISRAALSIILNIAEGSAKQSDREFARFLEISIASVSEVVACLDVAKDNRYISKERYITLFKDACDISKQLGGFIKLLRQNNK